jgi:hypothetical protein
VTFNATARSQIVSSVGPYFAAPLSWSSTLVAVQAPPICAASAVLLRPDAAFAFLSRVRKSAGVRFFRLVISERMYSLRLSSNTLIRHRPVSATDH